MISNRNQVFRRAYLYGADVGYFGVVPAGHSVNPFGKDNAISFFYASLVFSVLCALMLTFVWFFTWERRS